MNMQTCTQCGEELPERNTKGLLNFVAGVCKHRCYSNNMRYRNEAVRLHDPFRRDVEEIEYYDDIGYDCQRNQDILLRGLTGS